jgi:type I restriction enzyme, S subunit
MRAWPETQLKSVALKITKGTTPTTLGFDFVQDGINFIKAESITRDGKIIESTFAKISEKTYQALKRSQIQERDILVTIAGIYLGKIGLVRKSHIPANTNQAVAIVRLDRSKTCAEFIKYFLLNSSTTMYLNMLCPQSAQPNLNLTQLGNLKFNLPELALQKKIAAILSAYDDLIENNQRRIALLEKMAEEIYREWFVRMRFPGHKQVKFEKGVAEGWEYKELNELCSLIKRGISPKYDDESKSLVINQRCIRDGNVDLSVARGHETKIPKEKMIKYGDVLINSTGVGTLGRVSVLEYEVANLTCDTHVTICRADSNLVNVHFLAHTVKRLQSHFENMAIGATGQTELGREMVANTKVLLPTLAIQNAFSEQAAEIWKMKRYLSGMLKTLEHTRDSLLPRLISGKLYVENLDIHFPPSMRDTGHDQ